MTASGVLILNMRSKSGKDADAFFAAKNALTGQW